MTKSEILNNLNDFNGSKGFISQHKLQHWLGVSLVETKKFCEGMDYRLVGNRIEFFVGDVAEQVMKGRIRG